MTSNTLKTLLAIKIRRAMDVTDTDMRRRISNVYTEAGRLALDHARHSRLMDSGIRSQYLDELSTLLREQKELEVMMRALEACIDNFTNTIND